MLKTTAHSLASAMLLFLASASAYADEFALDLGKEGVLAITLPAGWTAEVSPSGMGESPTAKLTENGSKRFVVLVTPFWPEAGAAPDGGTDESLYRIVASSAAEIQPGAVEQEIKIEPIGGGRTGYMFAATDKSLIGRTPPPDEYLYMVQGALMVGRLLCSFTILTNERPSPDAEKALNMLRNAAHRVGA